MPQVEDDPQPGNYSKNNLGVVGSQVFSAIYTPVQKYVK
jgi:hypothetical protein